MRQVSVEADRWGTRLRVIDGFVDGRPWPTLSAVLYMGGAGSGRELVTVAVEPRIENRDVSYRLGDSVASIAFQRLAEKGLVEVDCSTGLALIQTGANRA